MMIEKIITKNNQDFQYFSESELTELRNESFVRSYKKGQVLFYPGDPRNHLILLVSGVIKIEKNDRSGNFSYLHFMKKQALFPRIGLFQDEVHYDPPLPIRILRLCLCQLNCLSVFSKIIPSN